MSTHAQQFAGRRNAQLSTGPRTPEGKAASSRNAVKHNLSGTVFVLLPGEDRAAFDLLARSYRDEWRPNTPHETFLVAQMVQARWSLDRIARMEAEVYDAMFYQFGEGQSDEGAILIAERLQGAESTVRKLHRYAQDAERSYYRAVRELRAHRSQRRKESENARLSAQNTEKRNEPKAVAVTSPPAPRASALPSESARPCAAPGRVEAPCASASPGC